AGAAGIASRSATRGSAGAGSGIVTLDGRLSGPDSTAGASISGADTGASTVLVAGGAGVAVDAGVAAGAGAMVVAGCGAGAAISADMLPESTGACVMSPGSAAAAAVAAAAAGVAVGSVRVARRACGFASAASSTKSNSGCE